MDVHLLIATKRKMIILPYLLHVEGTRHEVISTFCTLHASKGLLPRASPNFRALYIPLGYHPKAI
jgi:hypothetical protein